MFHLDEPDDAIAGGNIPDRLRVALPGQVEAGLGQRDEIYVGVLREKVADDDSTPEVDPPDHASSERDHLVRFGQQVLCPELTSGRLHLQRPSDPLRRLGREDAEVIV